MANLRDLIAATGLVILLKLNRIMDFSARVTSKFNGWPRKIIGHLFYTTSSFVHHFKSISDFKLESQSGNAQFGSKSTIFFSRVTLQFDGWLWKTIGHLFYATSSFVHHFVAIGEFKLVLQSGNAQFGSNSTIFRASPETPNSGQIRRFLEPCDLEMWWMTLKNNSHFFSLEIWRMTLKNNRASLLSIIKLYASFHHHMWIQTGVTVRKRLIWVKFDDF